MLRSIGWQELLIVAVILVANLIVPAIFIILAVMFTKRGAQASSLPSGSLDVRQWNTSTVRWLIAGTWFPFVMYGMWIAYFIAVFIRDASSSDLGTGFAVMMGLMITGGLVSFAMLITYVVFAVRSPIAETAKVMWCLAIVVGGVIAHPFACHYLVALPRRSAQIPPPLDPDLTATGG